MVIASARWRLRPVQVADGVGAGSEAGKGASEFSEVVPVAEGHDGGGQMRPGGGGVPGGQGQAAQNLVTSGQVAFQPFSRQVSALRRVRSWAGPARPVSASHCAHQAPPSEYRCSPGSSVSLIWSAVVKCSSAAVVSPARPASHPRHACELLTLSGVGDGFGAGERFGGGLPGRADQP